MTGKYLGSAAFGAVAWENAGSRQGPPWKALTGDQLLKKLAKQDYEERFLDFNPYPKHPKNREFDDMPVLYNIYSCRTFVQLAKRPNSSVRYEYKMVAPMLCFLFDARVRLAALPFGWNDSPRISIKVMRVLVEAIRGPQASQDQATDWKLRHGRRRHCWVVSRRRGGLRRPAHLTGARMLPYMDDNLVLRVSKAEALPTTVRLHTDSFLFAWGRRLQSEEIGAGFWNGDDLGCHITHLELEAITSREPALMWRMRRLRILLDLHNIELTTRHIRGEAKD
eukprot:gene14072-biopygen14495